MAYIVMGFGAIIACVGIILFMIRGAGGTSSLKLWGFEFTGGSSLVVFVLGIMLFILPFIRKNDFSAPMTPSDTKKEVESVERGSNASKSDEANLWFNRAKELQTVTGWFTNPQLASEYLARSYQLAPNGAVATLHSVALVQLNQFDKAIVEIGKAIRGETNTKSRGFLLNYRGEIYRKMGDTTRACEDFRIAKALSNDDAIRTYATLCR